MPQFDPLHPLQSAIIELLARGSAQSTQQISRGLRTQLKVQHSQQNLYRQLALMLDAQILVRESRSYALNSVWLLHAKRLIDSACQHTFSETAHSVERVLALKDGQQFSFHAESLRGLDPLWNDLLLKLAVRTKQKDWLVYNSHPYYALGMQATDARLFEALLALGIRIEMLFGNDSALDRYGAGLIRLRGLEVSINSESSLPREGFNCWVCDDFVIKVMYPDQLANCFAGFFGRKAKPADFQSELFEAIFTMRVRCELLVRRGRELAERQRQALKKALRGAR